MDKLTQKASSANEARRATINLARLAQMGILTRDGARSSGGEAFRLIKRTVLGRAHAPASGSEQPANLVLVSSAVPGEGKTFCSVNLAMSIAMELDHTVLLVDADVARPAIPALLGLGRAPGLMDLLLDPALTLNELILPTNIEGLSLLPAGRRHHNAAELLASAAMHGVLAELASRYADRIVVFDSPPILLTSEAGVLAGQMGQVLLVVESEITTRRAVDEALRRLGHCARVDLICNKARAFAGDEYDSYYD
ncbi:MAG TPA: XrtA-associated tyrosine autokinase [Telluria sp.]|jgi:exopolysaccharide/PEP-CTERM locus tyrosine autokinase